MNHMRLVMAVLLLAMMPVVPAFAEEKAEAAAAPPAAADAPAAPPAAADAPTAPPAAN